MPIVHLIVLAIAASIAAPHSAAALTLQQAYAQCRAKYAHMQEVPGTGNPVKEATIEGCVREMMSRQQQQQPNTQRQRRSN
jgi:hypothetical protein